MNSNRGIFEQDVNEFLQLNRRKYEHLLTSLVHTLERKLDTFDALGRIYRIYSRSDKQSGEIFKDAWKIMYKVNKERSKNPDFRIHEVGDIIGLTVVVPYPSDIDFVRHCIDEAIERDEFLSFLNSNEQGTTVYGEKKDDRGYHAYHYQLGINLSEYENARCELQIKTLLHDAWGAKTHDLTYKPAGEVDERLRIQIESVGDDLARLDQRSEGLLNLINETNKIERKKLENAIVGLFDSEPQTEDSTYRAQFADIKTRIQERKDKIILSHGTCEETDEVLMALRRMSVDQRSTRDTCRLYCLLAATARSKRLYRIAIDRINEWFLEARGTYDRVGALHGRAVTHYSFGYSVDAVMVGERALMEYARDTRSGGSEEKRDQGLLRLMARVRSNLAYFYADLVSSDAGRKLDAEKNSKANWSGPRFDRTGGIA